MFENTIAMTHFIELLCSVLFWAQTHIFTCNWLLMTQSESGHKSGCSVIVTVTLLTVISSDLITRDLSMFFSLGLSWGEREWELLALSYSWERGEEGAKGREREEGFRGGRPLMWEGKRLGKEHYEGERCWSEEGTGEEVSAIRRVGTVRRRIITILKLAWL